MARLYISATHFHYSDLLHNPVYQSVWELFWRIPSLLKEEDLFSSQQMLSSGKLTVNEKRMNSVANTKKKKEYGIHYRQNMPNKCWTHCSRSSTQNNKNTLVWKQINTNIYIIKELDSKSYVPWVDSNSLHNSLSLFLESFILKPQRQKERKKNCAIWTLVHCQLVLESKKL